MIIPDVNLLLYAYHSDSSFHPSASRWWSDLLNGQEAVGLVPVVVFSFVRIGTNARAFQFPMTPKEAADHVREWLSQPCVRILEAGPNHLETTLGLLEALGVAGNLATDAQIAAFAVEHDAEVHTADADFIRFPGVRWRNPMTGASSRGIRKK